MTLALQMATTLFRSLSRTHKEGTQRKLSTTISLCRASNTLWLRGIFDCESSRVQKLKTKQYLQQARAVSYDLSSFLTYS